MLDSLFIVYIPLHDTNIFDGNEITALKGHYTKRNLALQAMTWVGCSSSHCHVVGNELANKPAT
jgi:hypothetical protein